MGLVPYSEKCLCFKARKPHPPIVFHLKYPCVGVYPSFALLEKRKIFLITKISRYTIFKYSYVILPPSTLRMSRVAQEASKKGIRPGVRNLVLEICCTDANDEDAEVPYINYNFK